MRSALTVKLPRGPLLRRSALGLFLCLVPFSLDAQTTKRERKVFVLGYQHSSRDTAGKLEKDLFDTQAITVSGAHKYRTIDEYVQTLRAHQASLTSLVAIHRKHIGAIQEILQDPENKITLIGVEAPADVAGQEASSERYIRAVNMFLSYGLYSELELLNDMFLCVYGPVRYLKAKHDESVDGVSLIGLDSQALQIEQYQQFEELSVIENEIVNLAELKEIPVEVYTELIDFVVGFIYQSRIPSDEDIHRAATWFGPAELQPLAESAIRTVKGVVSTAHQRDRYMADQIQHRMEDMLVVVGAIHAQGIQQRLEKVGIKTQSVDGAIDESMARKMRRPRSSSPGRR